MSILLSYESKDTKVMNLETQKVLKCKGRDSWINIETTSASFQTPYERVCITPQSNHISFFYWVLGKYHLATICTCMSDPIVNLTHDVLKF